MTKLFPFRRRRPRQVGDEDNTSDSSNNKMTFGDADFSTHIESIGEPKEQSQSGGSNPHVDDEVSHSTSSSSTSDLTCRDDTSHVEEDATTAAATVTTSPTVEKSAKSKLDRLHDLVAYHTARANKLEAENTTLKLELANTRFDLEHTKLELRQMTTKRDALRTDLHDAMLSKADIVQTLGGENSDMIRTIDKLETERDILMEEVDKLKAWIVRNKGEGDVINEVGMWAGNSVNSGGDDFDGGIGDDDAWSKSRVGLLPPRFSSNKQDHEFFGKILKDDENTYMSYSTADSTAVSESDASMLPPSNIDSEDKLYPDEYIQAADEEEEDEDEDEDDEDNYQSFEKSYHRKKSSKSQAGQSTGQDDSSVDTADTGSSLKKEKRKKRIFGVSVKPRRSALAAPKSPNCVSHT